MFVLSPSCHLQSEKKGITWTKAAYFSKVCYSTYFQEFRAIGAKVRPSRLTSSLIHYIITDCRKVRPWGVGCVKIEIRLENLSTGSKTEIEHTEAHVDP
jgi:hypothetical protein